MKKERTNQTHSEDQVKIIFTTFFIGKEKSQKSFLQSYKGVNDTLTNIKNNVCEKE